MVEGTAQTRRTDVARRRRVSRGQTAFIVFFGGARCEAEAGVVSVRDASPHALAGVLIEDVGALIGKTESVPLSVHRRVQPEAVALVGAIRGLGFGGDVLIAVREAKPPPSVAEQVISGLFFALASVAVSFANFWFWRRGLAATLDALGPGSQLQALCGTRALKLADNVRVHIDGILDDVGRGVSGIADVGPDVGLRGGRVIPATGEHEGAGSEKYGVVSFHEGTPTRRLSTGAAKTPRCQRRMPA